YQLSYGTRILCSKRIVFVWDCKGRHFFFTSKLFRKNFHKNALFSIFLLIFPPLAGCFAPTRLRNAGP
ncbi:MAG: hypothetical protein IKV05_07640, partial [Bacteroidales bacterium]|nr:hypothetical protein [Bacteroidales bacterium]